MPKHRDPSDYEMITKSFRCFGVHAKLIDRAAAMHHTSVVSYMRKIVVEWAAADLGEPIPDYNALTAGPTQIQDAAASMGLSVHEFTRLAVRDFAARQLEKAEQPKSDIRELKPGARPSAKSGTMRKVGS